MAHDDSQNRFKEDSKGRHQRRRTLRGRAAAPHAQVIFGPLACMLSLTDMCDRPPVVAGTESGDVHDIGGHRLRFIATPHVPHKHTGQCPALTESDCIAPALEAEELFHATGLTTNLVPTLEQLAQLTPTTLALMHGASFSGDGAGQLRGLADGYAAMID